jgi:thiazole/oxazole-forming peptide maturase SagD family component
MGHSDLCDPHPLELDLNEPDKYGGGAKLCFVSLPYDFVVYRPKSFDSALELHSIACWIRASPLTLPQGNNRDSIPLFYPDTLVSRASEMILSLSPGYVGWVNALTGECGRFKLQSHPKVHEFVLQNLADGTSQESLKLANDLWVSSSGRSGDLPDLDENCGPICIVSGEARSGALLSLPSFVTEVSWETGTMSRVARTTCGGKSLVESHARRIARAEALERFQVIYPDPSSDLYSGASSDHAACVSLAELSFPEDPDDQGHRRELFWTTFTDLSCGQQAFVPAEDVWFERSLPATSAPQISGTTNGCALGKTLEEAVLYALFEYLERDAYLSRWYLRKHATEIDPATVTDPVSYILLQRIRWAHPHYRIRLFSIALDVRMPIVTVTAERLRGTGGKSFHASSAALSFGKAISGALSDLSMMLQTPYTRSDREAARRLAEDEASIRTPEDHKRLYMNDVNFGLANFLYAAAEPAVPLDDLTDMNLIDESKDAFNLCDVLAGLIDQINALGMRALAKDITHQELRPSGLHCARAIVTSMSPMWYGSDNKRINETPRMARLDAAFKGDRAPGSAYNIACHPFA